MSDPELDRLLARLNITVAPAAAATPGRGPAATGGAALATPPRPAPGATSSLLATPLSRSLGGRVGAPSPSLLDKYLGTPRPDLAPSRLGAAGRDPLLAVEPGSSLLGSSAKAKPDPLAPYRNGSSSSLGAGSGLNSSSALAHLRTRGPGGAGSSASSAGLGWESLPGTPASARRAGGGEADFAIAALRSPAAAPASSSSSLARADDGLCSVSLRLSAAAPAQPASQRLGADLPATVCARLAAGNIGGSASPAAASPAWQSSPRGVVQQPLASQRSDRTESSAGSVSDGLAALLGREQGARLLGCGGDAAPPAPQPAAAPLVAERGPGPAEWSMLQSRVNELQAQVGLL